MIVGFVGRSGAGKNEAAWGLTSMDTDRWHELSFAEPLKRAVMIMFGLSSEQVFDELREVVDPRWGLTPRFILRRVGTEVAREVHPNVWVQNLEERMREHLAKGQHIAVTDVRFLNEAAMLREWGAFLIRIIRPGVSDNPHSSEQEQDQIECDMGIANAGTLEELYQSVRDGVRELHALREGSAEPAGSGT